MLPVRKSVPGFDGQSDHTQTRPSLRSRRVSSRLAKTILQSTVKGGRRQGGQRKRWEDNIREWTGLEFARSQRAVENREKMEETGCEVICSAPTTPAVKGYVLCRNLDVKKALSSWQ